MTLEDGIVKMKCNKCTSPIAKVIDIDYNEFECNEINFHTPSEHTINGV
jgi:carbonic anhydrase